MATPPHPGTSASGKDSEGRGSCGGYELEHRGCQLVEDVAGDMQAVLGFPLRLVLPMLRHHCPREAGLLPA